MPSLPKRMPLISALNAGLCSDIYRCGLERLAIQGRPGEINNIADSQSVATIEEVERIIAGLSERKAVFDIPDDIEKRAFPNRRIEY